MTHPAANAGDPGPGGRTGRRPTVFGVPGDGDERARGPAAARRRVLGFFVTTALGFAIGIIATVTGAENVATAMWGATAVTGFMVTGWSVASALRQRRPGVDLLALLALGSALAIGETAAAAMIAVMLATGRSLEAAATNRAVRDVRALLARAPAVAHRRTPDGTIEDVNPAVLRVGDLVLVKSGETVPVDGRLADDAAMLDTSAITGESVPESLRRHDVARSGTVNDGPPFTVRAIAEAAESTYAGIVALVEQAGRERAPFERIADRIALVFIPISLLLAGAGWIVSGEPRRAVAVLVVATPCPLILGVPVAVVSGMARAASRGVIVKGGGVLERLASARTLVFDKTGTVTMGRPVVIDVVAAPGVDPVELLRAAGGLEQVSAHVLSSAVVEAAAATGASLGWPADVREEHGAGLSGHVDGRAVRIGKLEWLGAPTDAAWLGGVQRRVLTDGVMTINVELDGVLSGAIVLQDPIRADAVRALRDLRRLGLNRLVMASGDRRVVAEAIGAVVGADEVHARCSPEYKRDLVAAEGRHAPTVMVGDGINDAPALAVADVGVAFGVRGATAAADVADVVLAVDRIDRLADGVDIASRTMRIARQSVVIGMSLAGLAMVAAAAGLLPPLPGAIAQEVIDVAAVASALRAALPGRSRRARLEGRGAEISRHFEREHIELAAGLRRIREVADQLGRIPPAEAARRLEELHAFLVDDLLPHERNEDRELYPAVSRAIGGTDPTAAMSRAHVEISHLVDVLSALLAESAPTGPDDDDIVGLRRVLYGLDAVLRLHFAQEEQEYLSLADTGPT